MKRRLGIRDLFVILLMAVSVVLFIAALSTPRRPGDTDGAARKVERKLNERLGILDRYVSGRADLRSLPSDMVIYRYENDSLKAWYHQFPVSNDDIRLSGTVPVLVDPRSGSLSPLSSVGESCTFQNFGPKWYLVKTVFRDGMRLLAGLEIKSSPEQLSYNGVNRHLRLGDNYTVRPLSFDGGSAVTVAGTPVFKILYESMSGSVSANAVLVWLALAALISALMLFLISGPSLRRLGIVSAGLVLTSALVYFWGRTAWLDMKIFSPVLFADGDLFCSLGAVLDFNATVFLLSLSVYIARKAIYSKISGRFRATVSCAAACLIIISIAVTAFYLLRSIVLNSGISLELYRYSDLSRHSFLVIFSFIILLMSIPFCLYVVQPVISRARGFHINVFSAKSGTVFSALVAIFLVAVPAVYGYRKENAKLEVWANRLIVDRDIALELQLKRIEKQIASDPIIATLSVLDNGGLAIRNRLSEGPLSRITQHQDITVLVGPGDQMRLRGGEKIAEDSRFVYMDRGPARGYYAASFLYNVSGHGLSGVVVMIQEKTDRERKGYSAIADLIPPGKVSIPAVYSYARYVGGKLVFCHGDYAYPTVRASELGSGQGYSHFNYKVSAYEDVVISRESVGVLRYVLSASFLAVVAFLLFSVFSYLRRSRMPSATGRFARRMSMLTMLSLGLTLVVLALASVWFVLSRNESTQRSIMSEKIVSIQSMLSSRLRINTAQEDLTKPEVKAILKDVSSNTASDISLYAPDGHVIISTAAMVFERALLGSRMDADAYRAIAGESRRYFIHKEKLGKKPFYNMYAPLSSPDGALVAVICSPFVEDSFDMEEDTVNHTVIVLSVFILLLLLARFMVSRVMARLFKPLTEMGRKMGTAGEGGMESIEYDFNDEIGALVDSYNDMVSKLSESSRQLAQAERDKAWSGMARQVAHEIKNPLTPMKLQLQRIIRLKQKGDDSWQDKFDEMSTIILDHIDMLSQTANEFSTFAKLYSEESVEINLDLLLQEEIAMFDNRDDICITYYGFENAMVMGPKPQLTRVFVNIISNAVQAVEGKQGARIAVMLRKSTVNGFFDIVFEDNGPGVDEENVPRLFTPNFTTKNGGSGLGLAISRNVLERCGATISYSKSFSLGGACFTITYPV